MLIIDNDLTATKLLPKIDRMFEISGKKIKTIDKSWNPEKGAPVFTRGGIYTSRGWTEWTQGFLFGSSILQYDATGEKDFLEIGRKNTVKYMAIHVSNTGVHDHGFNNVSTYGNLLRLMSEGRIEYNEWEKNFYEIALKVSGAVQSSRWTTLPNGLGYIYSFNGPHSLFADTIRSLRSLAISWQLGHILLGEDDRKISLLKRLITHAETTAKYNVYFGEERDIYDVRGRVAHESIFNLNNGTYRCPSTQQGYSPFTTWTRALAWIILGFTEQLEFINKIEEKWIKKEDINIYSDKSTISDRFLEVALATTDYYIENTPTDGIPYWDTGAPDLKKVGDYLNKESDPYNFYEPVDSSAAAIAAQGLIRLGNYLKKNENEEKGKFYFQAGLTIANTLFSDKYLSIDDNHQGLILHSIYHRPKGWDFIAKSKSIPAGESSMWGDYHARELGLLLKRMAESKPYYTFYLK